MDPNAFDRPVANIATHLADVSKCKTSITILMTLDAWTFANILGSIKNSRCEWT